jgi:hypothetical protein
MARQATVLDVVLILFGRTAPTVVVVKKEACVHSFISVV